MAATGLSRRTRERFMKPVLMCFRYFLEHGICKEQRIMYCFETQGAYDKKV